MNRLTSVLPVGVRLAGPGSWNRALAVAAVTSLGCGAALGYAGAMARDITIAIAGGVLIAAGMLIMLAARWLDPLRVLVLSLPLPALYSTDSARIAPALLVSALVLIGWLIARGADPAPIAWRAVPWRAAISLWLAIAFTSALAQHPLPALRELINWCILLALLVVATVELAQSPQRVRTVALTIAGLAGVCGLLAFMETLGLLPARFVRTTSALNRAALGFGWPNELGMFMALTLPFSVYACSVAPTPGQRRLAKAGLAAAVIGLVATFSRGSWFAVPAGALLLLFAREYRFVLRTWVITLIAAFVLDVLTGGAIRERIAATIGDWVVEQRVALTLAGLLMFRAHPIAGVGPGGFADSLQEYGPGITWLWDYLPTAQNAYVQMAAEAGLIGLAALLLFYGSGIRALLRDARSSGPGPADDTAIRRTLLWSFGIALVIGFGEWTFAHGIGQLLMLIAAMVFARTVKPEPAAQP